MPPSEQTPLIHTVIVHPSRQRYPHSYVRRFCTAALTLTLLVIAVLFIVPARWLPGNPSEVEWIPAWAPSRSFRPTHAWSQTHNFDHDDLKKILLETPKEKKAREWSKYYTSGPHLAGANRTLAEWTAQKWEEFGVKSSINTYDVWLNYPSTHRLALLEASSNEVLHDTTAFENGSDYEVKYECSLEEDVLPEDPTSGLEDRIPTFHGYGANGNVTGRYVFANHGTFEDFEDLLKANITLKGNLALVKYGGNFRGLKVKRAEELGMIGVVMYSDPGVDGEVTEENGHKPYPEGPARQPSSVQRGSVQFINILSGDPTTPGYASKPGVPRQDPSGTVPGIPSQPISYQEAIPLLRALNGHGPPASEFNKYWQGGGLGYKGVEYHIGPSPPSLQLNLAVEHEYITTPIWNVIGIINGTLSDEVVVVGNHRDAWIAGGAGDPNSGSAALNEVIRSYGVALKQGWKPLRTIIFASWDGEEYGLIGSTEWVEEYMPWLKDTAVAYLNLDVGCRGPRYTAAASPLLHKALYYATSAVQSPNQTVEYQTIRDLWDGHIRTMGSGSDFTAFQDFAGVPAVDMGFVGSGQDPVYHYHSNYDSFAWMEKFGDKGWHYHIAIAKVWALLAAELAERPVISFNITDYAANLEVYLGHVKSNATASKTSEIQSNAFPTLEKAIKALQGAAEAFDAKAEKIQHAISDGIPWWRWWQQASLSKQIKQINQGYKTFERQFLYAGGLDGRPVFKHVVFAPGLWTGYSGATFPGLIESVNAGNQSNVEVSFATLIYVIVSTRTDISFQRWTEIIESKIVDATKLISS